MLDSLLPFRRRRRRRPRRRRPRFLVPVLCLIAAGALGTMAWLGLTALIDSSLLRVDEIRVYGTARVTGQQVLDLAAPAYGRPILRLDLAELRAAIEVDPAIATATVARRLPDLVEVRIDERQPVATARIGGRQLLVDRHGVLFPPGAGLPGDDLLPRLTGLDTASGATRLDTTDEPALRAIAALVKVTGRQPPEGTVVDLSTRDRIVLKPGPDAPALWLDRNNPEMNLEKLFAHKERVAQVAQYRAIDLRFPHRLTVVF